MVCGVARQAEGLVEELRKRLPAQRKTQRGKLALLVATMLHARSANLMALAASLPLDTERADMRYQWIARFIDNDRVVCDAVKEPFAREVLAKAAEAGRRVWLSERFAHRHRARLGLQVASKGQLVGFIAGHRSRLDQHIACKLPYLHNIELTHRRVTTNVGIINDPGHDAPWFIAMSDKPGYLTTLDYTARWGIEPMFSDFKSRGFGLEQSQLQTPDRLSRLLLVMSLARYFAVSTGQWDTAALGNRIKLTGDQVGRSSFCE